MKQEEKKYILMRKCKFCGALNSSRATKCHFCGTSFKNKKDEDITL